MVSSPSENRKSPILPEKSFSGNLYLQQEENHIPKGMEHNL
jgi:hypothetical protein